MVTVSKSVSSNLLTFMRRPRIKVQEKGVPNGPHARQACRGRGQGFSRSSASVASRKRPTGTRPPHRATPFCLWPNEAHFSCSSQLQAPLGQQFAWPMYRTTCGRTIPPTWWRHCSPLHSQNGMEKLMRWRVFAMNLFPFKYRNHQLCWYYQYHHLVFITLDANYEYYYMQPHKQ